ncbi:hypothetical protein [Hymenobacter daecheongensis]|uniref:hypothetical protein n=1 Tax=Hymenobacter daecheongensis TaxID=496053 RepID=UPI00093263B1|nr:hypothetical protein [Hymenobacter daecheongensis]
MNSLLITPASESELQLLTAMLKKMNIVAKVLSEDEKEDLGMGLLMKEAQGSPKVLRESVMRKLGWA